jgi:hypothetical protein
VPFSPSSSADPGADSAAEPPWFARLRVPLGRCGFRETREWPAVRRRAATRRRLA